MKDIHLMSDEKLIRHAYGQVVTSGSRLISFATGDLPKSEGPMRDMQEVLAVDDLASFAYHARRLTALTGTYRGIKSVSIPTKMGKEKSLSVSKILNIIVHSESLSVFRDKFSVELFRVGSIDPVDFIIKNQHLIKKKIPTQVVVKSDRSETVNFLLENLIEVYEEKILTKVIDLCDDNKIYLADDI